MARRPGRDETVPEGYAITAIPKRMVDGAGNAAARQWLEQLADKQASGVYDAEFQRLVDG